MPLDENNVYIEGIEKPYEAESADYLNFQIISALFSIERLESTPDNNHWENRCQYYHYYSDHLLYSLGQIINRFVITDKDRDLVLERKQRNRMNYRFCEEAFPILSDKRARNMVEHIDEYNQKIIRENKGVGGFNLIDNETNEDLAGFLRSKRDLHPYTLDLLRGELLIRWKTENLVIVLSELESELRLLHSSVKIFMECVFDPI